MRTLRLIPVFLLPAALILASACGGDDSTSTPTATPVLSSGSVTLPASPSASASPAATVVTPIPPGALSLTSSAFANNGNIPASYTCDGDSTSPPLAWSGVPPAAKGLALIVDDPDAPGGVFVHWVAFAIPADKTGFEAGVSPKASGQLPYGQDGNNGAGRAGYTGPCPPKPQEHHYSFRLYAVDGPIILDPSARSKADLEKAMAGHILAQAQLLGIYRRP